MWDDQESAVIGELERTLKSPHADAAYDQLPDSYGGRVLNADCARELSRDYRNKYDCIAFTRCTYAPCSRYVRERLSLELATPGRPGDRTLLVLAGGAASGKTSSVGETTLKTYPLVFDSNLADFQKARGIVDEALRHGWQVDVRYIHRPYALAVESMLMRAIDRGRYIPLGPPSKLAQLHLDAQRTIVRLAAAFPAAAVAVQAFENLWTRAEPVDARLIPLSELEPGGRFYYASVKALHEIEAKTLADFVANDRIEEGLLRALRETES